MLVSGQLYALAALPTRKEPLLPIKEEAGWALEPVWMFWRRQNLSHLLGQKNLVK